MKYLKKLWVAVRSFVCPKREELSESRAQKAKLTPFKITTEHGEEFIVIEGYVTIQFADGEKLRCHAKNVASFLVEKSQQVLLESSHSFVLQD